MSTIDTLLSEETKSYEQIVGKYSVTSGSELRQILADLKCMYVSETVVGQYSISHDSIRENLGRLYIKYNTPHALENIDFQYLLNHARPFGTTANDRKGYILLPEYCTDLFIQRMFKEITSGNVINVCAHTAWKSREFVNRFIKNLTKHEGIPHETDSHLTDRLVDNARPSNTRTGSAESQQTDDRSSYDTILGVFTTKDSTNPHVIGFNMMEALLVFEYKEAVAELKKFGPIHENRGKTKFK